MANYTRLCSEAEIPPATGKCVAVGDRMFGVFRHGGKVYVIDDLCPHRGGSLGSGPLDGNGVVTCPWHGWRYSVVTGINAVNPNSRVPVYNVRLVDGWVEAEIDY